jgi:hypothetical protein
MVNLSCWDTESMTAPGGTGSGGVPAGQGCASPGVAHAGATVEEAGLAATGSDTDVPGPGATRDGGSGDSPLALGRFGSAVRGPGALAGTACDARLVPSDGDAGARTGD